MRIARKSIHIILAMALVALGPVPLANAQVSANKDLDKCVKKQQMKITAMGAGAGLLGGLLAPDDGKDKVKNAAIGTAIGAAAGFAYAYFEANSICLKKNPDWRKEPDLDSDNDYDGARKEVGYDPKKHGLLVKATGITVLDTIKSGSRVDLSGKFIALSPDRAQIDVKWAFNIYVVDEDGTEKKSELNEYKNDKRTVPAGRSSIHQTIKFPDAKGKYRLEFELSDSRGKSSVISKTITSI